jgi:hypothetical protein
MRTGWLAVLPLLGMACGTLDSGTATHRDPTRGIQFEHASDWTLEEIPSQNVLLVMSPVVEANWQANVFIEVRTDQAPADVQSRLDALLEELPNYKQSFSLIRAQPVSHSSGLQAGEIVYTHVTDGVPLRESELIIWLDEGRTLFVTGSAVASLWQKYEPDISLVLNSVRPL